MKTAHLPSVAAGTSATPPSPKINPKILHAAREFEALLLANVLGPLEQSFSAISGDTGWAGSEAYQSMGMQALAGALANRGGIGIANMVSRSLIKREGDR